MTESRPNPYESPQTASNAVATEKDWKTWSPFQSDAVREICAHMTPEEKSAGVRRGFFYGIWVAVSLALPIQFIVMGFLVGKLHPVVATVGGLLVIAHLVCIPIFQRGQRRFLANTIWAREQQIDPTNIKFFSFGKAR